MFIKDIKDCSDIVAGDQTIIKEILPPDKTEYKLSYSLAHATLGPGKTSQKHIIKSSEVYYILEGQGRMHIDSEASDVSSGQAVHIPPHAVQYIENTGAGDLKFLCIVDPPWREENDTVLD